MRGFTVLVFTADERRLETMRLARIMVYASSALSPAALIPKHSPGLMIDDFWIIQGEWFAYKQSTALRHLAQFCPESFQLV